MSLALLRENLLAPVTLVFALGVLARVLRSDLALPRGLHQGLSVYLLLALGLKGGVELAKTNLLAFALPAAATIALGLLTPVSSFLALRRFGRFGTTDAAAIAAHYGSVSAVTFVAAQRFVTTTGTASEPFMPALLALMETPGIQVALALGLAGAARQAQVAVVGAGGSAVVMLGGPDTPAPTVKGGILGVVMRDFVSSKTTLLLIGGLIIGFIVGEHGFAPIAPVFQGCFQGALVLFLLDLGLSAGERLQDLRRAGPFLLAFGIAAPIVHGVLGVLLAHAAGLSVGGATVLGTMAASASYIAAPAAVRSTLPDANPAYPLALALGVTFPFNLVAGIPLFHALAVALG